MSNDLRQQIYHSMDVKDTAELLEIWKKNNHAEWSDLAFDVVREILVSRVGEIPIQDTAVFTIEAETDQENESEEDAELNLEEWEAKLVDNESQPAYYDTVEVIDLRRNIDRMGKIIVILSILSGIFSFPTIQFLFRGYFPTNDQLVVSLIASILMIAIGVVLNIITMYYPLKALAYILRILMEMEFNSRK